MILDKFQPDSASVASSIKFHAEFTPSFSPEQFKLPKAFHATAESVRDMLIIHWNATYDYYEKMNVKQAYYLSMEFLQVCSRFNNSSCYFYFKNRYIFFRYKNFPLFDSFNKLIIYLDVCREELC